MINALPAALFSELFIAWIDGLRDGDPEIVALDGKTSWRARRGDDPRARLQGSPLASEGIYRDASVCLIDETKTLFFEELRHRRIPRCRKERRDRLGKFPVHEKALLDPVRHRAFDATAQRTAAHQKAIDLQAVGCPSKQVVATTPGSPTRETRMEALEIPRGPIGQRRTTNGALFRYAGTVADPICRGSSDVARVPRYS